ncbi:hypothetical protein DPMN_152163 [Dreissena polymorpha]|uniref:C1q domain-containing protein n=1 Tax=Dreissena polymorpha TaxID=45954 RepID=A0A9D4FGQ0_DREPO|nr:hypothetical protein DPMN_152163 [Dreissena polymorpha]
MELSKVALMLEAARRVSGRGNLLQSQSMRTNLVFTNITEDYSSGNETTGVTERKLREHVQIADRRGPVFESMDIGRFYSASQARALRAGATSLRKHLANAKISAARAASSGPGLIYTTQERRNHRPALIIANGAKTSWIRDDQSDTATAPSIRRAFTFVQALRGLSTEAGGDQSNEPRKCNRGHTNADRSSRFIVDPTSQIAFTAFLSGQPIEINQNDRVPYNAVEINFGNGYDITKHEFTCPVNGVYAFHSSLCTRGLDHSVIQMLKDGVLLTTMSTRGDNTGEGYDQGTDLVLTICNKNQKILTIAATQYQTGERRSGDQTVWW